MSGPAEDAARLSGLAAPRPRLWTRDYVLNIVGAVGFFGSFFYLISVLPEYVDAIGGARWHVGLIMGGWGFLPVLLGPFAGRWSDRGRRKRLQRIALAASALAMALMVLSADVASLFLLRVVQGIGVSLYPAASASMAAALSPPLRRGEGIGCFSVATGIGYMTTPALGVLIARAWGYDAVFLAAAATAALTLAAIHPLREPGSRERAAAGSTLIPRRAIFPMLLFPSVTFAYLAATAFLPLLGGERGLGNAGLFFLAAGASAILARPIAGRVSDRAGRPPVIACGLVSMCAAMWLLALAGVPPLMWLAGAAAGAGLGAAHTGLLSYAVDRVPPDEQGRAAALIEVSWDLGQLIGAVVHGVVASLLGLAAVYWTAGAAVLAAAAALLAAEARAGRAARARPRRV